MDPAFEELLRQQCRGIFDAVERLHTELDAEASTLFDVDPGSFLAGDDEAAAPYHVSHAVIMAIGSSVDHLCALRSLFVDAGVFPMYASHSLLRTAIEAAATAWWMLEPPKRSERVVRRMRHELQDAVDNDRFAVSTDDPSPRTLVEQREKLLAIARRATGNRQTQLPPLNSTAVLKAAEPCSELGVLAAWQMCAGFAHARRWAALAALDREELPNGRPGIVSLRLTGSWTPFVWGLQTAWDVQQKTIELYRKRARNKNAFRGAPR